MSTQHDELPAEIMLMRGWLGEVFTQASRGLPWPQQAGLRLVEQGLALGMFGSLLSSAYLLQEFRSRSADPATIPDLSRILQALQQAALGPLPGPMHEALLALCGTVPRGIGSPASGPLGAMQELLRNSLPWPKP